MNTQETAQEFLDRAECAVAGHYEAANDLEICSRLSTLCTVGVGILVTVAGGVLIGELPLSEELVRGLNISVFGAGVAVTVLTLFQAVCRWGERSRKHKDVGARYADVRRKLEVLMLTTPIAIEELDRWSGEYTRIGESADLVPPKLWRQAMDRLKEKRKQNEHRTDTHHRAPHPSPAGA